MEKLYDDVLGTLEFDKTVWWKSLNVSMYGSSENIELLIQDVAQEGILDIQRDAYLRYCQNVDLYEKSVPSYILDYYKFHFEEIDRKVELEDVFGKNQVTENELFRITSLWYVFICRDGSYGWILGCSWNKKDGFAVLLSESEPRIISSKQLRNLHKINDPTIGLLVHDCEASWKGLERHHFFGELENLEIELEGSVEEGITPAQQKAYAEYTQKKEELFEAFSKMMLTAYVGDPAQVDEMLASGQPIVVQTVLPKTLYIDREGNYGWICYTAWNDSYIGVLLSDDKPYLMSCDKLRNYAREEKLKDEVLGIVFPSYVGFENIVVVRLVDEVYTLPLVVGSYDKVITEEIRQAYITFLMMRGTFWTKMREKMLEYYLDVYDDLEENLEIPDHFKRKNISQQNVLDMVMFTKLYISPKGRIAWLAEAPTDEEDGIAFEFTNGEIKLITQPEII